LVFIVEKELTMLTRLARLDSCAVSDALDHLGLAGATIGLRPLWPCPKIVGRAMTVLVGPKTDTKPAHHLTTPAIEESDPETVLLIANEGDKNISCWGDILANAACAKGMRGVIIDGACRDIDANREIGFPVYGRSVVPVSARNRLVQYSYGEPIDFAEVTARKGDYVLADGSGTIVIPAERIDEVLNVAERLAKREALMVAAVRAGRSVVEVMHDKEFDAALEAK
jgi:regulator of RNase E activity RraA